MPSLVPLLLLAGFVVQSGSDWDRRSAPEALGGYDPVLLVGGRQVPGREDLSLIHGGLWYRFASAETRDRFEAEPERYAVALGGVCARMGGLAAGDPAVFALHEGRLLLFSDQRCRELFLAEPRRYLKSEEPWDPPGEAEAAAARDLLDRAAASLGGARLDALDGYRLSSRYTAVTLRGELVMEVEIRQRFDGWFRRVERRPFGLLAIVLAPGEAFTETFGDRRPLNPGQRSYLDALRRRQLPALLWARRAPDLSARLAGEGVVAVNWAGTRFRLELGADGRPDSIRYLGRGPDGAVGRVVERYSDYRETSGLRLPWRIDATWEGDLDIGRSIQTIEWSPDAPAAESFLRPLVQRIGAP